MVYVTLRPSNYICAKIHSDSLLCSDVKANKQINTLSCSLVMYSIEHAKLTPEINEINIKL